VVPVVIVRVVMAAMPVRAAAAPVQTGAASGRAGRKIDDMDRPYEQCCAAVNRFICNFSRLAVLVVRTKSLATMTAVPRAAQCGRLSRVVGDPARGITIGG